MKSIDKLGDILQKLEAHVNFKQLAADIDRAAPRPSRQKGGRTPFPTELMVRVTVLQQLYSLSDEQLEFQLLDRLSFQRFAGLRHSSQIPDRTTFWTFRKRLVKAKASETLFDAVQQQLDQQGYIDQEREDRLKQQGLRTHIQRKATKNKPLSDCQKGRNTRTAKTRVRVEHVFAGIEQMGGKGLRARLSKS